MLLKIVAIVASAALAFAATNVDDLVVLSVLFGQGNPTRRVVAGQYVGFTVIVAVSAALSRGALALPRAWVGVLGLAPLFLGVRGLVRLRRKHSAEEPRATLSTWGIAAITVANGGDNIGVYTPMFTTMRGFDLAVVLAVFAVLVAVWCALARAFVRLPKVAELFDRWGHRLAPAVLIALGLYILFDAAVPVLLGAAVR
jgi:cadmium resistance protein CadD (predicted permease)